MEPHAFLVRRGTEEGDHRHELTGSNTTLGRWEEADVHVDDLEVSRRHAQIRHEGGRFVIADLGSKNGTRVNGVPVTGATPLRDGDEILLGTRQRFVFIDQDATVPAEGRRRIRVDPTTRSVSVGGKPLDPPLAPNQFALMTLLASEPERVFTREEIAAACYPDAGGGVSDQAIDGVVRRTRTRLAEIAPDTDLIVAVRGHGFKLGG